LGVEVPKNSIISRVSVFSKRISKYGKDLWKEANVGVSYRYFWTANAMIQVYDSSGLHKGRDLKGEEAK
jgi:hypothetical protein